MMFDIFKKDIKIGDKVKLYLTTGKEPEGIVVEIGDTFVLLLDGSNKRNRFFDKLIGGWDIINSTSNKVGLFSPHGNQPSRGTVILNREFLLLKARSLLKSLDKSVLTQVASANANIIQNSATGCIARSSKYPVVSILKSRIIDENIIDSLKRVTSNFSIPVYISINDKNPSNVYAYAVTSPKSIEKMIKMLVALFEKEDFFKGGLLVSILRNYIQRNKELGAIISELRKLPITNESQSDPGLTADDTENVEMKGHTAMSFDFGTSAKLFDLDITTHAFFSQEMVKNTSQLTQGIAKGIYRTAKTKRNLQVKDHYLLYLDAAKAFREIGIFESEYFEAITHYSILKANYLYSVIRNKIINGEINLSELLRLKDAAGTYYFQAIRLLRDDNSELTSVLFNSYLKLQLINFLVKNEIIFEPQKVFNFSLAETVTFLFDSKIPEFEHIFLRTIIDCGVFSGLAMSNFRNSKNFDLINTRLDDVAIQKRFILQLDDSEKSSSDRDFVSLLNGVIEKRKKAIRAFGELMTEISNMALNPVSFLDINAMFRKMDAYDFLLNETDKEIRISLAQVLQNLLPYSSRNLRERSAMLARSDALIERQLKYIRDNTSYFGRIYFYDLLLKWKEEVENLMHERNTHAFPSLKVSIDPPYYLYSDGEFTAPLLIKNEGDVTCEGFVLLFELTSIAIDYVIEVPYNSTGEIAPRGQAEYIISLPGILFVDSRAIQVTINAQAKYQGKPLPFRKFEFTLEVEPASSLEYEDIPWKDGPIPPEHLFKGRKGLISDLTTHYLSLDRSKPYILYGLTRTGKSSILQYLQNTLEGKRFSTNGHENTIVTFKWDLQEISNNSSATEFYTDILSERTLPVIKTRLKKDGIWDKEFRIGEEAQFKDLKRILDFLRERTYYPIFFIDELSYITDLLDRKIIGSGFLAALREYSLNGMASFVFAGTYDIKRLVSDFKYGITGQFVHAIDYQVDNISPEAARELINVINDKLSFTDEAVDHIMHLSGRIPYFIQIICKSCGDFAAENRRRFIGYPELERVVRILIGKEESKNSLVTRLPQGKFQNNQLSTSDPKEVEVLISSIAHLNRDRIIPRGIGFHELEKLWCDKGLASYKSQLADSIQNLLAKKILTSEEEEGILVYKFSVDLFRRWWHNHHQDINLELTTLIQQ